MGKKKISETTLSKTTPSSTALPLQPASKQTRYITTESFLISSCPHRSAREQKAISVFVRYPTTVGGIRTELEQLLDRREQKLTDKYTALRRKNEKKLKEDQSNTVAEERMPRGRDTLGGFARQVPDRRTLTPKARRCTLSAERFKIDTSVRAKRRVQGRFERRMLSRDQRTRLDCAWSRERKRLG